MRNQSMITFYVSLSEPRLYATLWQMSGKGHEPLTSFGKSPFTKERLEDKGSERDYLEVA